MRDRVGPRAFQLLVSVRNAKEAAEAVQGGADVVDVKEPTRGSLGRADWSVLRQVTQKVRALAPIPVSAALGDLAEWEEVPRSDYRFLDGLAYVKVGMHGEASKDWLPRFLAARRALTSRAELIPVAYADFEAAQAPPMDEIVEGALAAKASVVLLDTFSKGTKTLWDWVDADEVHGLAERIASAGARFAVAGSLSRNCLSRLAPMRPAIVAVRGAACAEGIRNAAVVRERVAELAKDLATLRGSVVGAPTAP